MKAIILCGGKGTRLKDAIPDGLPKCMADINGKPFLYHLMDYWRPYVDGFILAAGHGFSQIEDYFGHLWHGVPITYTVEIRGKEMALKRSLIWLDLDENFFLLNGDTFFEINVEELLEFHKRQQTSMTLSYSLQGYCHGGADVYTYGITGSIGSVYPSNEFFIDIGTPETLEAFRIRVAGY